MKRKIAALFLTAVMCASSIAAFGAESSPASIPAFPGAEGGGKYTSGGRGQEVYIVDSLEDYAEDEEPIKGTLRDAVSQSNRTVVFNVSGVIRLKDTLQITNVENITLAGQTAPGDGITVYGYDTNISDSNNIIIRYMRFRVGAENVRGGDSLDALWGRGTKNAIVDHVSTSWSTDETMSIYRAENLTVQWSVISESLTMSGHTKGRHGYGAIWGGVNATYHHNLVANHTSRNPRMGGGTPEADDNEHIALFDVRNNVIYNWGFNTIYGGGRADVNFVNNYELPGPGTRDSVAKRVIDAGEKNKPGRFYVNGNVLVGSPEITSNNSLGIYVSDASAPTTQIVDKEFEMKGTEPQNLHTDTPEDAYNQVLAKAGAVYPRRDALDARIISEVKEGKGRYANTDYEVGGLPYTASEKRSDDFDTDKDGMPDKWELERGLNPSNPEDGKELTSTGYTNLEVYLNSIVDFDYEPENPTVSVLSPTNNQIFDLGDTVAIKADITDKDGIAKVEFFNRNEKIGEKTQAPYELDANDLPDGTHFLSVKATDSKGNQTQASLVAVHVNDTAGSGEWLTKDIGQPNINGNTTAYKDGSVVIKGAGKLRDNHDSCHFAYVPMVGDCEITAKLDSITAIDNHAFSGLMMREDLTANSMTAALGLSYTKAYEWKETDPETGKVSALYRNPWSMYLVGRYKDNGSIDELGENLDSMAAAEASDVILQNDIPFKDDNDELGYFMKLNRTGDVFTAYISADGQEWTELGSRTIRMAEKVYVGMAVDANKVDNEIDNLNTVKFSNISINGKPAEK